MSLALSAQPEAAPAAVRPLPSAWSWARPPPRTAGTTRRASAFLVDAAIIFALAWTITFIAASVGLLRIPDIEIFGRRSPAAGLMWIVSIFEQPLLLAYMTLFEGLGGRTPGKVLLGLRVARADGGRPSFFDAFLRNLLRVLWITPFGPAFVLLDAWSLSATELDQRMGDLAAGTVVVETRGIL